MNMLQCDCWLLGTFYLLSPSIAIFMTLCRQIYEFPDISAVKGLKEVLVFLCCSAQLKSMKNVRVAL